MSQKDILVLEDEESVAQLLKVYLEEEGYAVRIAADVRTFWSEIGRSLPDLISLDILLPDGDGFILFQELLEREDVRHIPVIFITVRENEKEKGFAMGAAGYIVNPFAEADLKITIAKILRNNS